MKLKTFLAGAAVLALILLAPLQATAAQLFIGNLFQSAGRPPSAGGGGGATADLLSEDCEGTGRPSGWTLYSGSDNWDYTTTALVGSQSLSLGTTDSSSKYTSFGSKAEVWTYYQMRFIGSIGSGTLTMQLKDAGDNSALQIDLNGNLLRVYGDGGAVLVSTVATVSADVTYHIWAHYKKGTASDDISEIWFSTTGTKPASGSNFHAIVNTGTGNRTVDGINLWSGFGTAQVVFDKIRVSSLGDLGDNPN